jgi:hypothetical protein
LNQNARTSFAESITIVFVSHYRIRRFVNDRLLRKISRGLRRSQRDGTLVRPGGLFWLLLREKGSRREESGRQQY